MLFSSFLPSDDVYIVLYYHIVLSKPGNETCGIKDRMLIFQKTTKKKNNAVFLQDRIHSNISFSVKDMGNDLNLFKKSKKMMLSVLTIIAFTL